MRFLRVLRAGRQSDVEGKPVVTGKERGILRRQL